VVLSLRQLRDLESAWIVALNHFVTAVVLLPYLFDFSSGSPALNVDLLQHSIESFV
jgi:hypothetical protein